MWDMSRELLQHWRHLQDCQDKAHAADMAEVTRLTTTNKVGRRLECGGKRAWTHGAALQRPWRTAGCMHVCLHARTHACGHLGPIEVIHAAGAGDTRRNWTNLCD